MDFLEEEEVNGSQDGRPDEDPEVVVQEGV